MMHWLRFNLKSIFLLSLGWAIGYAWNLWVWRVEQLIGSEAVMFRMPTYVIEPPDVIRIDAVGEGAVAEPDVAGEHLVGMDGRIKLGKHGFLFVSGLTIAQAEQAVNGLLSSQPGDQRFVVDVVKYNSKVYYIIDQVHGRGDGVTRAVATGDETVLDAITMVGADVTEKTEIWIARPAPNGIGPQKIIPIDYEAITDQARTSLNYQLYPGDRVFISEKETNGQAGKTAATNGRSAPGAWRQPAYATAPSSTK